MTREMLPCRDHAVILQAMDERGCHPRGGIRILTIGACIDDGVIRIVVDVEDGRVRDVNPERAPLECGETSLLVSERRISRCTNRHLWREYNRPTKIDRVRNEVAASRAESRSGLEIRSEQKRNPTHRLQRVELRGHLDWRTHSDRE